jgi:hypothetical protein
MDAKVLDTPDATGSDWINMMNGSQELGIYFIYFSTLFYFIYKKIASGGQTNPARFVLAPFMCCNGPTSTTVYQFNAL